MALIGESAFEWLEFDKEGRLLSPGGVDRINADLSACSGQNLVIISHGWNNDRDDAWKLYHQLWLNTSNALRRVGADPSTYVVAGVLWPAIKSRTDFDVEAADAEAVTQNTLSVDPVDPNSTDLSEPRLRLVLDDFVDLVGTDEALEAREIALRFVDDDRLSNQMVDAVLNAIDRSGTDPEEADDLAVLELPPSEIVPSLALPLDTRIGADAGETLGLGDRLRSIINGPRAAAGRLFNLVTYYTMKKRAGVIGRTLGGSVLPLFRSNRPLRLHLVGHSFGARLVTSAAHAVPPLQHSGLHSLVLLQGAFSHNAFAGAAQGRKAGVFEGAQRKVVGSTVITHTHNDSSVTLAYAIASRLAGDSTRAIGGAGDPFGAMGANGALHIDQDLALPKPPPMSAGVAYAMQSGKVHNMKADNCINGHSDVANKEVGRLLAATIR